jgi:HK97 family phage major capsid protein
MTAGTFLTGAFALGAAVWDREDATIRVADEHDDFFVRNMVAILCEERVALTVYRTQAFVKGSLPAVGT